MVHPPVTDLRAEYTGMIEERKYTEAYEFLLKNPEIIDDMRISELAGIYQKFIRTTIPIGKLRGLTRVLKERVLGEDADKVFS